MRTILVVDDDPIVRELFRRLLPRAGYAAVVATNGMDALAALENHAPDLVLLDLAMPKMDGLTFLQVLRQDSECKNVPVILISALASRETVKFAGCLGVRDYFVKSEFSMETLWARIRQYLPPEGEAAPGPGAQTEQTNVQRPAELAMQ